MPTIPMQACMCTFSNDDRGLHNAGYASTPMDFDTMVPLKSSAGISLIVRLTDITRLEKQWTAICLHLMTSGQTRWIMEIPAQIPAIYTAHLFNVAMDRY